MTAGRDRLSSLPTELLDKIFDDAWSTRAPSGPLNRALCAFSDRYAWRAVRLDSAARLGRFLAITEQRTALGSLCQELEVELEPAELDPGTFGALVTRTPNLKRLVVGDVSDAVADLILAAPAGVPRSGWSFPTRSLRELEVTCTTGRRQDPYHPSHWSSMLGGHLPRLRHLALDLRSTGTPTGRIKGKGKDSESPSWPDLEHLAVGLPQKGRSSVLQLIACFPTLRCLELSSSSPVADFAGALDAVQDLSRLQELVLVGDPKKGWTLPAELKHLTGLLRLQLVGDWHRLSVADVDHLCDLESLQRFELGRDSDYPLMPFVRALRLGKLSHLETLAFRSPGLQRRVPHGRRRARVGVGVADLANPRG